MGCRQPVEVIHFGDDRHGSEWNPQVHTYLHNALGAQKKSGLYFSGIIVNGDGSSNTHAQFSIVGGIMMHDDFELKIPSALTMPILYFFGGLPRFLSNAGFSVYKSLNRLAYNNAMNSLTQCTEGYYVIYHYFATNEIAIESRKMISVMGIAQYDSLGAAYINTNAELVQIKAAMPQQGKCYLGSVIYQTSSAYTNTIKARIVGIVGNELSHPPVSIAPGSEDYLFIDEKQELSLKMEAPADDVTYGRKNKAWVPVTVGTGGTEYDWNIHSPEQIIGFLEDTLGADTDIDGAGTVIADYASGDIVVTAINENGETIGAAVPAFTIYDNTTIATLTWEPVAGATAYRVHVVADELFTETTETEIDLLLFEPVTAGTLPAENTAAIYQNPFKINNGDTVEFTGEGIDVETSIDETDSTLKNVLLKKQQSDWEEVNELSPNFIKGKPIVINGREVEMSTLGGYIVWRYVGDVDWINLVSLASITGLPGLPGTPGSDGDDGREIELRENAGWVEWRYVAM